MSETDELRDALDRLHAAADDLVVRGVRAAGPREVMRFEGLRDEMRTAGAGHLADRLGDVAQALRDDDRAAAPALLRLVATVRLFERWLTLEAAGAILQEAIALDEADEDDEP